MKRLYKTFLKRDKNKRFYIINLKSYRILVLIPDACFKLFTPFKKRCTIITEHLLDILNKQPEYYNCIYLELDSNWKIEHKTTMAYLNSKLFKGRPLEVKENGKKLPPRDLINYYYPFSTIDVNYKNEPVNNYITACFKIDHTGVNFSILNGKVSKVIIDYVLLILLIKANQRKDNFITIHVNIKELPNDDAEKIIIKSLYELENVALVYKYFNFNCKLEKGLALVHLQDVLQIPSFIIEDCLKD